jgi:hypothetical protein
MNIVRLLLSRRGGLEPTTVSGSPSPREAHAETCGVAHGGMQLGPNRGHSAHIALGARGSNPHEYRALGQVGQESNLQPAVLEPAAVRSAVFRDVHERA